jgi:hypothetical protein
VGLERGPLSLVSTIGGSCIENREYGRRNPWHVAPFISTSWQSLRRQAAVARSV